VRQPNSPGKWAVAYGPTRLVGLLSRPREINLSLSSSDTDAVAQATHRARTKRTPPHRGRRTQIRRCQDRRATEQHAPDDRSPVSCEVHAGFWGEPAGAIPAGHPSSGSAELRPAPLLSRPPPTLAPPRHQQLGEHRAGLQRLTCVPSLTIVRTIILCPKVSRNLRATNNISCGQVDHEISGFVTIGIGNATNSPAVHLVES